MEQAFTNGVIETASLPDFEDVQLTPLHNLYWKVILFNLCIFFISFGAICGALIYFIQEVRPYWYIFLITYLIIASISFIVNRTNFKNSGFAFRAHDVIYRNGAIALTTTIIPYNRVQHAAMHEGFIARKLGLATVEIFTAGGLSSDIKIPGIEKQHAENIKQLLMGKILNQAANEQ